MVAPESGSVEGGAWYDGVFDLSTGCPCCADAILKEGSRTNQDGSACDQMDGATSSYGQVASEATLRAGEGSVLSGCRPRKRRTAALICTMRVLGPVSNRCDCGESKDGCLLTPSLLQSMVDVGSICNGVWCLASNASR